jgi:hypothetical protein
LDEVYRSPAAKYPAGSELPAEPLGAIVATVDETSKYCHGYDFRENGGGQEVIFWLESSWKAGAICALIS